MTAIGMTKRMTHTWDVFAKEKLANTHIARAGEDDMTLILNETRGFFA